MPSLSWIDFDEEERQRTQRILELFNERESRDELGLGAIRDSIADHLFPGTSTIQTRLRYMLFVPWIYRMLESRDHPSAKLRDRARDMELRLIDALKAGGEKSGIIGSVAGRSLKRLPSSIYWAGLGSWGVRVFNGSVDSLYVDINNPKRRRRRIEGEDSLADGGVSHNWHPALPRMPENLLERTDFRLTKDEAQFLVDRLIVAHPNSLLTMLARDGIDVKCDYIWMHPNLADFPDHSRRLVRHAEIFSDVMYGASLLYNLALSELRENEEWTNNYLDELRDWSEELDFEAVQAWSLEDFWNVVNHPAHNIHLASRRFVTEWRALVLGKKKRVIKTTEARELVKERERKLKGGQSRYDNRSARDRWTGASGAYRLSFRWDQTNSHLGDIARAK